MHAEFDKFLHILEKHFKAKPIIYTGTKFWEHAMKEHLPGYQLWIAEYGVDEPTIPEEWQTWTFWQFTEEDHVAGIPTVVDGSHFHGKPHDLRNLTLKQ